MLKNSNKIENLFQILNHEEILWKSIEKSYNELIRTSKELEKRFEIIEEERNEWKTRYENQKEINQQFKQQVSQLEEKLSNVKSKNRFVSKSTFNEEDEKILSSNLYIKREDLNELLTNLNWRIEQEIKTYHKANEERKSIQHEIHETRNHLNAIKEKTEQKINQNELFTERNNKSNQEKIFQNLSEDYLQS